jgi:hypothetical protein
MVGPEAESHARLPLLIAAARGQMDLYILLLQCRGEKIKVIRCHDLDVRT